MPGPNFLAFIVSMIFPFIRTDRRTDTASSIRLVICHAYFNAHKPPTNFKKIVHMSANISETIKDRELEFQILIP